MTNAVWPPKGLALIERGLDQLAEAIADDSTRSLDEQVWLTRFYVVRACGYLEQVVHETVTAHIQDRAGGTVRTFALSWLTRSRAPSPENLCEMLGRLDGNMRNNLEDYLDAEDGHVRRELSLLVHRRHHIAHGLNEGLGTRKAIELGVLARDLADWFILTLNPGPTASKKPPVDLEVEPSTS